MTSEAFLLTRLEIEQITGKVRYKAQIKTLRTLNIPVLERPDGSPCVSRQAAKAALGATFGHDAKPAVELHLEAI